MPTMSICKTDGIRDAERIARANVQNKCEKREGLGMLFCEDGEKPHLTGTFVRVEGG